MIEQTLGGTRCRLSWDIPDAVPQVSADAQVCALGKDKGMEGAREIICRKKGIDRRCDSVAWNDSELNSAREADELTEGIEEPESDGKASSAGWAVCCLLGSRIH
jgi:hypothetical protein